MVRAAECPETTATGKERIVTAHRSVQYARHATIVVAGAASLSLTVAAGAYIVHEMADTQRGVPAIGEPVRQPAAVEEGPRVTPRAPAAPVFPQAAFRGARLGAVTAPNAPELAEAPELRPDAAERPPSVEVVSPDPADPTGPATRFGLGDAYVDATVTPSERDAVTVTLDTNLFAGLTAESTTGVTRVVTEVDTRRGAVTVAVTDPVHGDHDLRIDRTPAPAPSDGPRAGRAEIEQAGVVRSARLG